MEDPWIFKKIVLVEAPSAWTENQELRNRIGLLSRNWHVPDCLPKLPQTNDCCMPPFCSPFSCFNLWVSFSSMTASSKTKLKQFLSCIETHCLWGIHAAVRVRNDWSVFQLRCPYAATDISKPKESKFVGEGTELAPSFLPLAFFIILVIKYIYKHIWTWICVQRCVFPIYPSSNSPLTSPQIDICPSLQWKNSFAPL